MSFRTPSPPRRVQDPTNPALTRTGTLGLGRERSGVVAHPNDHEHFVRIDHRGHVVTGHGDVERLAAFSAYACRMADLIGEHLELGPVLALEATFSGHTLFVYRDAGAETVGLKPRASMSLRALRSRLKL